MKHAARRTRLESVTAVNSCLSKKNWACWGRLQDEQPTGWLASIKPDCRHSSSTHCSGCCPRWSEDPASTWWSSPPSTFPLRGYPPAPAPGPPWLRPQRRKSESGPTGTPRRRGQVWLKSGRLFRETWRRRLASELSKTTGWKPMVRLERRREAQRTNHRAGNMPHG